MRSIVNSTQIDDYFNSAKRDAQELLPHLVRRLIFATLDLKSLVRCRIPVGDDIGRPGYDGRVEAINGNSFVPMGLSVWEMGTGDPKNKAGNDYNKRTHNLGDIDPAITSFVFVTPHKWDDKDSWAQEKQEQGIWKSVRVLDNVDLETWFETAPGVARWLARQIGIPIDSFRDIDLYLDELCTQYGGIKILDDLIIGGRDETLTKLSNWIKSDSKEIIVQGESIEEAAAFIAAAIRKLPNEQGQQISAQTLFVNEQNALDFIASCRSQHFVVPLNPEFYKRAKALKLQNVRLMIPLTVLQGYFTKGEENIIKLGPVHRRPFCEMLKNMGIPSNKADRITSESKGSLGALLLLLGGWQDETLPWMSGEATLELIPLMFAGQWSVDNKNDQNVIEKLSGKKYSEVEQTIARWKTPTGPLIRRGPIWDWLAWDFAWGHLASEISEDQIKRFIEVAKEVLSTPDPRFELSADKRWAAAIYSKVHQYSSSLREGLVCSIVQVAIHSNSVLNGSGQAIADSLVRLLLIGQNETFPINTWLSVSAWLPDLAEASPGVFLEACEKLLKNKDAINKIFEEGDVLFSLSEHTHLLWALERLAWSEQYLTRVTLILGELSAIDPGGKLGNRPINSLTEVFLPWHPQTKADLKHRLVAIEVLYQQRPDIGWSLAISLLPESTECAMGTANPRWRDWKTADSAQMKEGEYWTFVRELVTRMISWAGNSGDRWPSLIESYNTLRRQYPELGSNLLSAITNLNPQAFSEADKVVMSEKFREMLTQHRKFHDAEWSMSEEDLSILEELYKKFQPADIVKQYTWLFDPWPEVPISMHVDYKEEQEYVQKERLNALNVIFQTKGLEGLFTLAKVAQSPYHVGFSASRINMNQPDELGLLKRCLSVSIEDSDQSCYLQMGLGFVRGRYQRYGIKWAENIVLQDSIEWDDNKYVNLALGLPADKQTWDLMEKWGENIPQIYWKNISAHNISPYEGDPEYAITKLFEAGRPYAALNLASFTIRSSKTEKDKTILSKEVIIKLLEEAPKHDPRKEKDVAFGSLSYDISELLDILEAKGAETSKLVQLEWAWMPALEHSKRGLKSLQQALNEDPKLFIEILKILYRGKNEAPQERSEQKEGIASQVFRLLSQWKVVPGLEEMQPTEKKSKGDIQFSKGQVNQKNLFSWVREARKLASECDRLDICDIQIGHVLAYSPSDQNGYWPCEAVRNLIEEIASSELEHGIEVGVYNKRGVHFRAKGGAQERGLAVKFRQYAQQVSSKWPHSAAMLNRIADGYEREAHWHDEKDAFEEFE